MEEKSMPNDFSKPVVICRAKITLIRPITPGPVWNFRRTDGFVEQSPRNRKHQEALS
jgi:hypothetical protein